MITNEKKAELISKFGDNASDSGKAESQIAIFTERINLLTQHLEQHKKDNHSRRGLIQLVAKRRKLLDYLAHNNIERYRQTLSALSIRK